MFVVWPFFQPIISWNETSNQIMEFSTVVMKIPKFDPENLEAVCESTITEACNISVDWRS